MNICIQLPLRLSKMQDQKSLTCRWLSFSGWGRERFSLVLDYKGGQFIRKGQRYTNVNILQLAIGYLNVTIHSKTRKPKPEIGTDGSSQTRWNPRVHGYESMFGPVRCSGSSFWMGLKPNWAVLPVQTRTAGGSPRLVANTSLGGLRVASGLNYILLMKRSWMCTSTEMSSRTPNPRRSRQPEMEVLSLKWRSHWLMVTLRSL